MKRSSNIDQILQKLSKGELISIIAQIAERDEQLRNTLLLQYGEGDDKQRLSAYSKLIKSTVKSYKGRERYISYRETYKFATDMIDLLHNFDSMNNLKLALDAAFLMLEEAIEAFQYADDSNGDIGMLVDQTLQYVHALAYSLSDNDWSMREFMLKRLLGLRKQGVFDDWDEFQLLIYRICIELVNSEKLRNMLKAAIEDHVKDCAKQEFGRYTEEALLMMLYELLEIDSSSEELAKFRRKYIRLQAFRKLEIAIQMELGDYQAVIKLAQAGEKQDNSYRGLVLQWKKSRYEAYRRLGYKSEQSILAKELLLEGEYEYYEELKALEVGDPHEFYKNMITELKQRKGWGAQEIYLRLIAEHNDVAEMMEFVRLNPAVIEHYASVLLDHYTEEINQLYRAHIMSIAASASNRSNYRKVCEVIKRYKKLVGKEASSTLVAELKEKYPKRTAFLDELNRIK